MILGQFHDIREAFIDHEYHSAFFTVDSVSRSFAFAGRSGSILLRAVRAFGTRAGHSQSLWRASHSSNMCFFWGPFGLLLELPFDLFAFWEKEMKGPTCKMASFPPFSNGVVQADNASETPIHFVKPQLASELAGLF